MATDLFTPAEGDDESHEAKIEANFLENLVGDGKKFKDPESLAKGKYESDLYIEQLKKELDGIRKELGTRMTLEEFWEKQQQTTLNSNKTSEDIESRDNHEDNSKSQVNAPKPEEITELVRKELSAERLKFQKSQNVAYVESELTKTLGPNFRSVLRQKADELGAPVEFLASMAETQPKAFLSLMGGASQQATQRSTSNDGVPPRTQVNSSAFGQNTGKNFAHYEKLRKENPTAYWSPKVQNEMFKEAKAAGEAFYNL